MRRDLREKMKCERKRKIMYFSGLTVSGILLLTAITLVVMVFFNIENTKNQVPESIGLSNGITSTLEIEAANSKIGKTIEEQKNSEQETKLIVTNEKQESNKEEILEDDDTDEDNDEKSDTSVEVEDEDILYTSAEESDDDYVAEEEISFQMPVEGEIIKDFAKDKLVYSDTLKEWVTHLGIDIKADKTTVVKSAEAGTIKSIKNDPRYGLTVVIDHKDRI